MKKKVGYYGVFLALALVLSYVESLIPFYFGVPGMKLGLTNVIVLILLYLYGPADALIISVTRVILAGFLFGNAFSIIYSLAGALFSFVVMALLKRTKKFQIVTVSAVGGICHNLGQILVAVCVVENYHLMLYFPMLMAAGIVMGLLIGVAAREVLIRLQNLADKR